MPSAFRTTKIEPERVKVFAPSSTNTREKRGFRGILCLLLRRCRSGLCTRVGSGMPTRLRLCRNKLEEARRCAELLREQLAEVAGREEGLKADVELARAQLSQEESRRQQAEASLAQLEEEVRRKNAFSEACEGKAANCEETTTWRAEAAAAEIERMQRTTHLLEEEAHELRLQLGEVRETGASGHA